MKPSEVKVVPIPNSLLQHPCEPVGPGNTVESLAKGYAINTACVGEYKITIDGIKQYNKKQEELRDGLQRK